MRRRHRVVSLQYSTISCSLASAAAMAAGVRRGAPFCFMRIMLASRVTSLSEYMMTQWAGAPSRPARPKEGKKRRGVRRVVEWSGSGSGYAWPAHTPITLITPQVMARRFHISPLWPHTFLPLRLHQHNNICPVCPTLLADRSTSSPASW